MAYSVIQMCRKYGHIVGIVILGCVFSCHGTVSCPPLTIMPGTVVRCELPESGNLTLNCLQSNIYIPKGTVARFRCERNDTFGVDDRIKCKCKGRWSGLQKLNDFMSKCNISDYPNAGPEELNLTKQEILQLSPENLTTIPDFQENGAAFHNLYRKIHHSPPLELNDTLSDAAQKWADHEVDQPSIKTQDWSERKYAQNMYRFTGDGVNATEAVKLAVAAWYQGAYLYNWENPNGQSAFTQVVWKSTKMLGIGVAQQRNRTLVVANYFPPGNVIVENPQIQDKYAWFRENVFPPNQEALTTTTTTEVSVTSITTTETPPKTTFQ